MANPLYDIGSAEEDKKERNECGNSKCLLNHKLHKKQK